jgi:hypothetical protein
MLALVCVLLGAGASIVAANTFFLILKINITDAWSGASKSNPSSTSGKIENKESGAERVRLIKRSFKALGVCVISLGCALGFTLLRNFMQSS